MDQIVEIDLDFSGFPHSLLRDLCKEYEMYQYLDFLQVWQYYVKEFYDIIMSFKLAWHLYFEINVIVTG